MKEVLRNNKKWVIVYLLIGLLLALRKIGRMDYSAYQKLRIGKLVQQIENFISHEQKVNNIQIYIRFLYCFGKPELIVLSNQL